MTEMKDAVLAYVRNINTQPGPNAGCSIDPTKPGPTADRIAELEREIADLERFIESIQLDGFSPGVGTATALANMKAELSRLRNEQSKGGEVVATSIGELEAILNSEDSENCVILPNGQVIRESHPEWKDFAPSPAPSPGPQDVREKVTLNDCPPGLFMFNGTLGFKSEYKTESAGGGWQVDAYVVESGEYFWGGAPNPKERGELLVEPIPALAQSDAQPVVLADDDYDACAEVIDRQDGGKLRARAADRGAT